MIYIKVNNRKYYLDTTKITGRNLKLYIELSYLLNQKSQDKEVNEENLKRKIAEFITSFCIKKITVGYLLKNTSEEDFNMTFELLFKFLLNVKKIDLKILRLFPQEKKEEIIQADDNIPKFDFGDDDDFEEENQENSLEKILDMINSLYDFSMENLNCSFIDLEERIDWFSFLDFLHYKLFRKKKLENERESLNEDIFDKEF